MAKPEFIAEVGRYEGTPESLEAVIKELHPSVNVSLFSAGTWYLVTERQGLGYARISVALFHGNSTGNGIRKTEPATSNGSHSLYNVQISVSSPEVDCQQYIDRIAKYADITLLREISRRSISLNELNGRG